MKNIFITSLIALMTISCGGAPIETNSNTELVVHYEGKEVHRRGGKYISEKELVRLIREKEDFIIIFAADWCQACTLTMKAIKQADLNRPVYYINLDATWAKRLAAEMEIKSIPLMIHTDSKGKTKASLVGPSDIVLYLLLNFS